MNGMKKETKVRKAADQEKPATNAAPTGTKLVQFNWRRHWSKKVAPHLEREVVQFSLDLGMGLLDPRWRRGDPPCVLGAIPSTISRVVTGKLTWYQVWGRCHWIAFFSMAIGVLNYPHLDWRFLSGDLHSVPVGYGPDREPRVVMDILLFDSKTAEESIAFAMKKLDDPPNCEQWAKLFELFVNHRVPTIRAIALEVDGRAMDEEGQFTEPLERASDREAYRR